jgi:uncharacterized protein YybS (DUF2232 family)
MDTRRFLLHLLLGTVTVLIIFLILLQVPLLGMVTGIIIPLPIMVMCRHWGLRGGILIVLIGTLIISSMASLLLGIVFFTEFGLLGILLYHYLVRKQLPWDKGIALSSLPVVTLMALFMIFYGMATSVNLIDWVRGELQETGRSMLQLYQTENASDQPLWIASEKFADFVLRILPSLIIMTIWLEGLVNIFLFTRIMNRGASENRRIIMKPEFSAWACPDRFVWGGIIGGFLILTKSSLLVTIGINVVIVLLAIYFLQGLAIVSFLFKKNHVPLGFRVLGYVLIGTIQFLVFLVAALGLFDIWIDFRKLRPRTKAYKKSL